VRNILPSILLSKILKIKIQRTVILRVVYVDVILGKVAGTCECGNEHYGSIEWGGGGRGGVRGLEIME
jgi:hypothetical protein